MTDKKFKSGLISLVGLPNAGKSTLLNHIAGMHLAITSPKKQTTRQVIRAIIDEPQSQMIFLDTPGWFKPKTKLDRVMARHVSFALSDADVLVLITDAQAAAKSSQLPVLEQKLLERLTTMNKPVILALNKVDQAVKETLLPVIDRYNKAFSFKALIPISAKTGDGVSLLLDEIRSNLPEGPRYYLDPPITDQTERQMAAEFIRENVLFWTHDEIPHGVAVMIESFEEKGQPERNQVVIEATIICDKASHKGMIIGKNGTMLKKIGTGARIQIEKMLDCPCYLSLYVKTRPGWRDRIDQLRSLGFETKTS